MNTNLFYLLLLSALMLSSCSKEEIPTQQQETVITQPEQVQENTDTIPEIVEPIIEQDPVIVEPVVPKETIEEYFDNSVFVGDSVMHGLQLYSNRNKNIQSKSTFLTITSFSARHAISTLSENSYHPSYNGQKMLVEDALALDNAKRVFISIGLNDVLSSPNTYFDQYTEFIRRIKEKNPEIEVHVFSPTPPVTSGGKLGSKQAIVYRDKIAELNQKLFDLAQTGEVYYVDVATPLKNEAGFLNDKYSSDGYVHLTNKAYEFWSVILNNYADARINNTAVPYSQQLIDDYIASQAQ